MHRRKKKFSIFNEPVKCVHSIENWNYIFHRRFFTHSYSTGVINAIFIDKSNFKQWSEWKESLQIFRFCDFNSIMCAPARYGYACVWFCKSSYWNVALGLYVFDVFDPDLWCVFDFKIIAIPKLTCVHENRTCAIVGHRQNGMPMNSQWTESISANCKCRFLQYHVKSARHMIMRSIYIDSQYVNRNFHIHFVKLSTPQSFCILNSESMHHMNSQSQWNRFQIRFLFLSYSFLF